MGQIAFYAPLKPPDHSVPSGDRTMARAIVRALSGRGDSVDVVSAFKSMDKTGKIQFQDKVKIQANAEVDRILSLASCNQWQIWVTYHNYYKAPDLIGPQVCTSLGIPYVQIESTRALKRLNGPWDQFARDAESASDQAEVIFYFTQHDRESLIDYKTKRQQIVHLAPFLSRDQLPDLLPLPRNPNCLFCAGMMRGGDKVASYRIVAESLARLRCDNWVLKIAGDGPASAEIHNLFNPFGDRVEFLGRLDPKQMEQAYREASLFVWPGVNEAFGVVYLEAQAFGLPVVAQDRPGVRDIIKGGVLTDPDDTEKLAHAVDMLLADRARLEKLGATGRSEIEKHHLLPAATSTLMNRIHPLMRNST